MIFPLPPNLAAPALLRSFLDLLRLNFPLLGLLLPALELLLHSDPGLLPDGGYTAIFYGKLERLKLLW